MLRERGETGHRDGAVGTGTAFDWVEAITDPPDRHGFGHANTHTHLAILPLQLVSS